MCDDPTHIFRRRRVVVVPLHPGRDSASLVTQRQERVLFPVIGDDDPRILEYLAEQLGHADTRRHAAQEDRHLLVLPSQGGESVAQNAAHRLALIVGQVGANIATEGGQEDVLTRADLRQDLGKVRAS